VESLSSHKSIFSRCKRATKGSSFCGDEKKFYERKLEAGGWNSFLKKRK
jgi:hypothetical protein